MERIFAEHGVNVIPIGVGHDIRCRRSMNDMQAEIAKAFMIPARLPNR